MYPKAMNNISAGMGYSDQGEQSLIPGADLVTPEWVKNRMMWPIYESMGNTVYADPTTPFNDALKFAGDPVSNSLGMLTPLARIPAELMKGSTLQGDIPIRDKGDYFLKQLPATSFANAQSTAGERGEITDPASFFSDPRTLQFLLAPGLFENTDRAQTGELLRREQDVNDKLKADGADSEEQARLQQIEMQKLFANLGIK
jgi:hypothetical protein